MESITTEVGGHPLLGLSASPRIGAPAVIAQPQTDEMALLCGIGVVDKSGAAMPQGAVVDKLDLAGFEVEIDR